MCDSRLSQLTNAPFIVEQMLARNMSLGDRAFRETRGGDAFFLWKRGVRRKPWQFRNDNLLTQGINMVSAKADFISL